MSDKSLENYIQYIGLSLKERALKAKLDADQPKKGCADYNTGYLMAFHEVIDFMKQQAIVFNLEQEDVGLADIDPDADLLSLHRKTDLDHEQDLS